MKLLATAGYAFNPAATPAVIDFSATPGVTPSTLLAIIDATAAAPVFAAGKPGLGGTWQGQVLQLQASTAAMLPTDQLLVVYDDGAVAATDATLQKVLQALQAPGSPATADQSVAVAAGADVQALAAAQARQMLLITNTGPNVGCYRFGAPATATSGHILGPGQSQLFAARVPAGALHLFSTAGTSFFVTTG